jgi:hypothetical protein
MYVTNNLNARVIGVDFGFGFGFKTILNAPATCHTIVWSKTVSPFGVRGTWPHGPMRPTPPSSGALISLTVRQIGAFCGTRVCWVYAHENAQDLGSLSHRCRMANQ